MEQDNAGYDHAEDLTAMILQMLGKREESTKGKWQRWKSHRTRLWEHELKVKKFQGKKGFNFALWMQSQGPLSCKTLLVFCFYLKLL